jgi:hypothetical protein
LRAVVGEVGLDGRVVERVTIPIVGVPLTEVVGREYAPWNCAGVMPDGVAAEASSFPALSVTTCASQAATPAAGMSQARLYQ